MILNGTHIAETIYDDLQQKISKLDTPPTLWAILVWENIESMRYITQKKKFAKKVGMNFKLFKYPDTLSQWELVQVLESLNTNPQISGYILQLPLPPHIDTQACISHISPEKDVDGFHPQNQGKVVIWDSSWFVPCTPLGIMKLFDAYQIELTGKIVCILGKSNIVGKPLAALCKNAWATLISCNSQTPDIATWTQQAEIVVSATGIPHILTADMVQPDAVIIDVGFTLQDGKICGDADFSWLLQQGNSITPVPGWVGPMTVAMLISNTYDAHIQLVWNSNL